MAALAPVMAYESSPRYIFISAPAKRSIYYSPLPTFEETSKHRGKRKALTAQVLINGNVGDSTSVLSTDSAASTSSQSTTAVQGTLLQPQGLAMWHGKDTAVLYVADTQQGKVFSYEIHGAANFDPDNPMAFGTVQAGNQKKCAENINQVSGLTVDGYGNVYYSTLDGKVGYLKSNSENILDSPTNTILYDTASQEKVQSPYSMASDSFFVYWANQANGQQQGSVVAGFKTQLGSASDSDSTTAAPTTTAAATSGAATSSDGATAATGATASSTATNAVASGDYPKALAQNAPKAMGVCTARNKVFFTGETQYLYGVGSTGGSVTEVYTGLGSPRGCAYDGDSTLYVADAAPVDQQTTAAPAAATSSDSSSTDSTSSTDSDSSSTSTDTSSSSDSGTSFLQMHSESDSDADTDATSSSSTDSSSSSSTDSTGTSSTDLTSSPSTSSTSQAAGAVYSMPSNFPTLRAVQELHKVVTMDAAPDSVVVFTRAEAYILQDDGWFSGWR